MSAPVFITADGSVARTLRDPVTGNDIETLRPDRQMAFRTWAAEQVGDLEWIALERANPCIDGPWVARYFVDHAEDPWAIEVDDREFYPSESPPFWPSGSMGSEGF